MQSNIPVTRSSMPPFEEYCAAIKPLWESRWLTNFGSIHEAFEQRLRDYLGIEGVSLFTNGHLALEGVFEALDLKGEVITTPFTFASTAHALVRSGLEPVFCDTKEDDFTLDPACIEELITSRTTAIVPVHVYGTICDVDAIDNIAQRYGLKVIYDAAHAFAETYKGISVAHLGDASMFSFHATKVFNSIEGGLITTSQKGLLDKLRLYKNFGIRNEEEIPYIGTNAKMNEFAAAMGLCNLDHLAEDISARRRVEASYREGLKGVAGIQLNVIQEEVGSNHAYFPIVIHEEEYGHTRDELAAELKSQGIYVRKYFYPLISDLECYKGFKSRETPVAKRIAQRVLTLPQYASLATSDVERVCEAIRDYQKENKL